MSALTGFPEIEFNALPRLSGGSRSAAALENRTAIVRAGC
jgi:hypothetical protein